MGSAGASSGGTTTGVGTGTIGAFESILEGAFEPPDLRPDFGMSGCRQRREEESGLRTIVICRQSKQ